MKSLKTANCRSFFVLKHKRDDLADDGLPVNPKLFSQVLERP